MRYLHFHPPFFARQIAGRAPAEFLHQIPRLALRLQLRAFQPPSTVRDAGVRLFGLESIVAREPTAESAQDVRRRGRVFGGRVDGGALARRQLVELRDVAVVAERVRPPARDEEHAVALHVLEQLPPALCRARQLLLLFRPRRRFRRLVRHGYVDGGDGAQVAFAVEEHGLVVLGCFVESIVVALRLSVSAFGVVVPLPGELVCAIVGLWASLWGCFGSGGGAGGGVCQAGFGVGIGYVAVGKDDLVLGEGEDVVVYAEDALTCEGKRKCGEPQWQYGLHCALHGTPRSYQWPRI